MSAFAIIFLLLVGSDDCGICVFVRRGSFQWLSHCVCGSAVVHDVFVHASLACVLHCFPAIVSVDCMCCSLVRVWLFVVAVTLCVCGGPRCCS